MSCLPSASSAGPRRRWLAAVAVCLGALVPLAAQSQAGGGTLTKAHPNSMPSLASMAQAVLSQDYTAEQLRRFRDESGSVTTVRERLEVDADGSEAPPFQLTFLGVEGEPSGSALDQQWQQSYARYGSLFVSKGGFRVRNLQNALGNYTLHDFGQVVRAGRVARRMVVFPNGSGRPVWVLDIDSLTSVPLFVIEFDQQLRVVSEIEVVQFTDSTQQIVPTVPSSVIAPMPDFAMAETYLGSPAGLIDPDTMSLPDYSLSRVEVHTDPINGQQKLVMNYTDGIDEFAVVQAPGTADPFAGMPGTTAGHTIGRFRDPALSALVFWDDGVVFHVAGRGALTDLDALASRVYRQALSN